MTNIKAPDIPAKLRKEVEEYIEKNAKTEKQKKEIWEIIKTIYACSVYDPEEPIGVVTAQSLSEPATQLTMRTYHFAGTAGIQVTLGLPRLLEIFDARKEPRTPAMTVYLDPEYKKKPIDEVKRVAENIKEVKLKDVTESTIIDLTDMVVKCKINMMKIEELEIDPKRLPKLIKIRNTESRMEGGTLIVRSKKKDITIMHKLKYNLMETHIKGIKGISQVVVTKEGGEWKIDTLGSNLKKVFDIKGVDTNRTTTNNIFEIYDVLGIEAARNSIIEHANFTMEDQGLGVDIRYIMLLGDLMTVTGVIQAIGRYGISGKKASVLVRASFEETKKHLTFAAIKGEVDNLNGTIENIIMNQVAPIGTGAFDIIGRIPDKKAKKAK